ncbi:hypothetical protein PT274_02860 [Leuconostocaceae bacterium ESL0958]|nr:hypothetical protein [Leuconostocaceae bacterium ESL0958]
MLEQMEVADDYQTVKDQVAILNARGEEVSEDDVLRRTLKAGLEEILDYRLGGTYYKVLWNEAGGLDLVDVYGERAGQINPLAGQSLQDAFRADDQGVWDRFNDELKQLVSR